MDNQALEVLREIADHLKAIREGQAGLWRQASL